MFAVRCDRKHNLTLVSFPIGELLMGTGQDYILLEDSTSLDFSTIKIVWSRKCDLRFLFSFIRYDRKDKKCITHNPTHNPKIAETVIFEKIMDLFLEWFASIRFLRHKF